VAALNVAGSLRVPGDKSLSHRALIVAALAEGESHIRDVLVSGDVAATAGVLRAVGIDVPPLSAEVRIHGRGVRGLVQPSLPLDCGNSGTTARLMAGIAAAHPFKSVFVGDASLSRRPMRRVAQPLEAMGARFEFENEDGLPMSVHGATLKPVEWTLDAASAQIKSAILLAAVSAGVEATVRGGVASRDHTERLLAAVGVPIRTTDDGAVTVRPVEDIMPLDFAVPADPSSAAFFAALAALADSGELELAEVCLNPTRMAFFGVLSRMGATVAAEVSETRAGEPVGIIRVAPAGLVGLTLEPEAVAALLDELPLVACLAALAEGETTVTGAAELRVKESDRISTVVRNLQGIGADAEELADGFVVRGSTRPLRGSVTTHGDHRIAMSFGIIGRVRGNEIKLDDPSCVAVSYPGFWDDLERIAA